MGQFAAIPAKGVQTEVGELVCVRSRLWPDTLLAVGRNEPPLPVLREGRVWEVGRQYWTVVLLVLFGSWGEFCVLRPQWSV